MEIWLPGILTPMKLLLLFQMKCLHLSPKVNQWLCLTLKYKTFKTLLCLGTKFMGFSGDNTMILFAYEIKSVWRHSFTARYLVLDTTTNKELRDTVVNMSFKQKYLQLMF